MSSGYHTINKYSIFLFINQEIRKYYKATEKTSNIQVV
jgi:hypothetical protein